MSKLVISDLAKAVAATGGATPVHIQKPPVSAHTTSDKPEALKSGYEQLSDIVEAGIKLDNEYQAAKILVSSLKKTNPQKKAMSDLMENIDRHPERLSTDIVKAKEFFIKFATDVMENRKRQQVLWQELDKVCGQISSEGLKQVMEGFKKFSPEEKSALEEVGKDLRDKALEAAKSGGDTKGACSNLEGHRKRIIGRV